MFKQTDLGYLISDFDVYGCYVSCLMYIYEQEKKVELNKYQVISLYWQAVEAGLILHYGRIDHSNPKSWYRCWIVDAVAVLNLWGCENIKKLSKSVTLDNNTAYQIICGKTKYGYHFFMSEFNPDPRIKGAFQSYRLFYR